MFVFSFFALMWKMFRVYLNSARSCENLTHQFSLMWKTVQAFIYKMQTFLHFPIDINVNNRTNFSFLITKNQTSFLHQCENKVINFSQKLNFVRICSLRFYSFVISFTSVVSACCSRTLKSTSSFPSFQRTTVSESSSLGCCCRIHISAAARISSFFQTVCVLVSAAARSKCPLGSARQSQLWPNPVIISLSTASNSHCSWTSCNCSHQSGV